MANSSQDGRETPPREGGRAPGSLPPSSVLDGMLEAFGLTEGAPVDSSDGAEAEDVRVGQRVADRFEVTGLLVRRSGAAVFTGHDDVLDRDVLLKVMNPVDGAQGAHQERARLELRLARSLSHPNICRVHDLVLWKDVPILVTEHCDETLQQRIEAWATTRWPDIGSIRSTFNALVAGLNAIHVKGLAHGALNPGNVFLAQGVPKIVFGPATPRDSLIAGLSGPALAHYDAGYFSRERLAHPNPTTSPADDVYALGVMLWQLLSRKTPQKGLNPRAKPMLASMPVSLATRLTVAETRQLFDALAEDADDRPPCRRVHLAGPHAVAAPGTQDVGPPPAGDRGFVPGGQGLLVTYAPHARQLVGSLYSLKEPVTVVGRDAEISIPERTLSGEHARLEWRSGTWHVVDLQSTNGTYFDHAYGARDALVVRHGDFVQLGELRLQLVNFQENSVAHWRARRHLRRCDGLTGYLLEPQFLQSAEEDAEFADWTGCGSWVVRFEAAWPSGLGSPVAMLGTRRAAHQIEALALEMWPGYATFGVLRRRADNVTSMGSLACLLVGRSKDQPEEVVRRIAQGTKRLLPTGTPLTAAIYKREYGESIAEVLIDVFDRAPEAAEPR